MATSPLHTLLLLSDSALPLGSFAFSSGLESFLAHTKHSHPRTPKPHSSSSVAAFESFLQHSIQNLASTALPYILTAYHDPPSLRELDNAFDASTPCTVARRASITQGRALLTIWERALAPSASTKLSEDGGPSAAISELNAFATAIKTARPDAFGLMDVNAHFAPLFGAVGRALRLEDGELAYLFLLNHAKAVLSAAVRASIMGPYQAQALLASERLQGWVRAGVERETAVQRGGDGIWQRSCDVERAAVTVPVMDLWMGRHELLYSRIFNS